MSSTPPQPKANKQDPPPKAAILVIYFILGAIISFSAGREPGNMLPTEDIYQEMAPVVIVICGFLASYSLWDVMEVGIAKLETNHDGNYKSYSTSKPLPERVYLAQRVQTNQVEQLPVFLLGSLSCAFWVNGRVAGIMSLAWAILRRMYASTYRSAIGASSIDAIGLSRFTLPCYFLSNAMLMASAIQALRYLVA